LKKGILWKVTKDTVDIENEELFFYARSRLKSSTLCPCIEKKITWTYQKREKLEQREIQE
jgi:hypothetical protein